MSSLYIHMGMAKTGTTAIQQFFARNGEALKQFGISYPVMEQKVVLEHRNGHFLATRDYDRDLDQRNWGIVESELKKYDTVILSDETIFRTSGYIEDFWRMLKRRLDKVGANLKVIFYIRRQDDFLWSYYMQMVRKTKRILPLRESVLRDFMYMPYWDYYNYTKRLESVLGKGNVIVRVYEKEQFKSERESVVDDILEYFGIGADQYDKFQFDSGMSNPSMGDLSVAAKRLVNKVFFEHRTKLEYHFIHHIMNSADQKLTEKGMIKKRTGMTSDLRKKVLKKYRHSNEKLAREYFGREDLFFNKTIEKGDTEDVFSRDELEYTYNLWVDEAEAFPECGYSRQEMREICDEALKIYDREEQDRSSRLDHCIRYFQRVKMRLIGLPKEHAAILRQYWDYQ